MSDTQHDGNHTPRKARGRWTAIALAAVAGLAIGGGAYAWRASQEARPASQVAGLGQAGIGGPFQLMDQNGRPTTEAVLKGKWSAVFFGYTACPDFCPATLQTLQAATKALGPAGQDLQVVLITVDPARDTPEQLKAYLDGYEFPGGVRGLTGTPEQVEAAGKAWRVYSRKAKPGGAHAGHGGGEGGYLVDHTTVVYLTNPQGEFVQVLSHELTPEAAANQIRAAQAQASSAA
jgi:protein SCO1/2